MKSPTNKIGKGSSKLPPLNVMKKILKKVPPSSPSSKVMDQDLIDRIVNGKSTSPKKRLDIFEEPKKVEKREETSVLFLPRDTEGIIDRFNLLYADYLAGNESTT